MKKSKYIPPEKAVEILLAQINEQIETEEVSLMDAAGRTLAEDVFTKIDQPPFDRSPLDGYAVFHGDIQEASKDKPAMLRVTQYICAGDAAKEPLAPGEAARIMTGAPLPSGATCVVRQEDTSKTEDNLVHIYTPLNKHQNYCWRGEDVKQGIKLLKKGRMLDAASIAALAGQGYEGVKVFRRPVIGILSTGSELTAAGQPLEPGKIYDSNRYYIAARVKQLGGDVVFCPERADDPDELTEAVRGLMLKSRILITTGGVSVGDHDYMPLVGKKLEAVELFRGVDMKPGSPALAFEKDGKLILCLSGNPFAAAATFEVLARPFIKKLCGNEEPLPKTIKGFLENGFDKASGGRRLIRARIEGNRIYLPGEGHASGVMASMIGCNCLVDIPAGSPPLSSGTEVEVILL